jgi:hypothetical protein
MGEETRKGGITIGSMSGHATFSAGGDIVAGDKITQTTATTLHAGFKQEDDKQQFLQQIDALRAALREVQAKVQESPGLDQDAKDEIAAEVAQQIGALKKTKDQASALTVAAPPPPETRKSIEGALQGTCTVLDKLKGVCDQAIDIGEKVAPYVIKALPIVASARHLFGIP